MFKTSIYVVMENFCPCLYLSLNCPAEEIQSTNAASPSATLNRQRCVQVSFNKGLKLSFQFPPSSFSHQRKLMQIRCQKGASTKIPNLIIYLIHLFKSWRKFYQNSIFHKLLFKFLKIISLEKLLSLHKYLDVDFLINFHFSFLLIWFHVLEI